MKLHNIAVELTLNETESRALPPAVRIGVYRIVQEARPMSRNIRELTRSALFLPAPPPAWR